MQLGIDIGGTFTDFVFVDDEARTVRTLKVMSTPESPARAVLDGIRHLQGVEHADVVHGSTVATNALLERKGARTASVTTRGFRDLLTIARQTRGEIYDLFAARPEPIVPPNACFEVTERVDHLGQVLTPLDESDLPNLIERMRSERVESVAVCLLFSFLHAAHEERVADALRGAGFAVSRSSEILPEHREYERASTTVINAYVAPVLERYLAELELHRLGRSFRVMQSNGGSIRSEEARRHAVRTILSGPAGGVVGAIHVARASGFEQAITFDMGGTSTDVSLSRGRPEVTSEAYVGGLPIRVPVIDIHTIGSGGGSIAYVDAGGALRVGPESAGADPGPACYGHGGSAPTVTDANVVLGRLPPDRFLGGEMELDAAAAHSTLGALAKQAGIRPRSGLDEAQVAALGVVQIANAHMERAVRVISVARGHDPIDFVFVSFGGAGGLHACDLARGLGMKCVLVPSGASTLSAYGMLVSDVMKDYVRTIMASGETPRAELARHLDALVEQGRQEVLADGIPAKAVSLERELDIRYSCQAYELTVPFSDGYIDAFHAAHKSRYGHADVDATVEIVNVRVRAVGVTPTPPMPRNAPADRDVSCARLGLRRVVVNGAEAMAEVYDGGELSPGHRIVGPAIIAQSDTTIFLSEGDAAHVDEFSGVQIEVASQ